MCVCVFPETTTHFESLLSRIKAASKERKRERRTTTTNALRLVGLGRRSPGYEFCILLLLKRCEEITTTHSFIIVAFFYLVFFCINLEWDKNGKKSSMVSSSQTQSNQKRGSCEKSAKPNNKEKIDENPKPRSEKKEAHEETKTKSRVWSQGETFLNNTTQKGFVLSFLLYSLSLSITRTSTM